MKGVLANETVNFDTKALRKKFQIVNLRITEEIFVFSPNRGECGPEKTPYFNTFHAVRLKHMY